MQDECVKQDLKVLCVGPIMPPVHGQSMAFTRLCESLKHDESCTHESTNPSITTKVIDTNITHLHWFVKIWVNLYICLKIFVMGLFYSYDLVYFTCSRSFLGSIRDILLIQVAHRRSIPIINHLHGSDFYQFLHQSHGLYHKILMASYAHVHTSIVLLDTMRDQVRDFPHMNVEVIYNFYDEYLTDGEVVSAPTAQSTLTKICEQYGKDHIHILYLSNIMKSKGVFELIRAHKNLQTQGYKLYLHIVGRYMSDEYMSAEEAKKELTQHVSMNQVSHDHISELCIYYWESLYGEAKKLLLHHCDLFILPSYYKSEAFPISIIEAMACESAIITSRYKYLPSIINDDQGKIVEPQSVESLQQAIEFFIQNPTVLTQMKNDNRLYAQTHYTLATHVHHMKKLFQTIYQTHHKSTID